MDLSIKSHIAGLALALMVLSSCGDNSGNGKIGTDMIESPGSLKDNSNQKEAKIEFEKTEFSTGKITQGEVLNFNYKFKNSGNAPLIISDASGSCGCTVLKNYPKGKIMPGEGGTIDVEFDSDKKWGKQTVTIDVTTNAVPAFTQLLIRTEIVTPDNMKTNKQQ